MRFDLAIVDLGLPDGNGMDLLPTIQDKFTTPVIIFFGREVDADIVDGVAKVLSKSSTSTETILETVKSVLKGK